MFNGNVVEKKFNSKIYAENFKEYDVVVVVIRSGAARPDNACILSCDGDFVTYVKNPFFMNGGEFTDLYYIQNKLNLIVSTSYGQFACEIDGCGNILKKVEIR